MSDDILMAAYDLTPDDLMHHGVKGMKWGVRRSPSELALASGGANGGGAVREDIDELEESINEAEMKVAQMKADGASNKEIAALEKQIQEGKKRVNDILKMSEKVQGVLSVEHAEIGEDILYAVMDLGVDDLAHHGILGMKWGIRRFQPYRQGMKVAGGKVVGAARKVKQRFKSAIETHKAKRVAKTEAKAAKKTAASEAEKQRIIKSGTAEELSKYKGNLSPQEYSEAFLRLQNEKKLDDLVNANKKSGWDVIDKGFELAERFGNYANKVATIKTNFDKMDEALNKKSNEDKKKQDDAAKNEFMNKATYEELVRDSSKYGLTTDEYQKALKRIQLDKVVRGALNIQDPEPERPAEDHTVRENAGYDNSNPSEFTPPPRTIREKAGYVNPDGEQGFTRPSTGGSSNSSTSSQAEAVSSGKRVISGLNKTGDKITKYNSTSTLNFGESTVRRLSATAPSAKQVKKDMAPTAAEKERATRINNVKKTYSMMKKISGVKVGSESASYKQTADLEFGDSSVKRFSAQKPKESNVLASTRSTVNSTQQQLRTIKALDELNKRNRR